MPIEWWRWPAGVALLACSLAAACATEHRVGPFVRNVRVVGGELMLERCLIERRDDNVRFRDCVRERRKLPAVLPDHLDRRQVLAGLAPLRPALARCALAHDAPEVVRLRLTINPHGTVRSLQAQTGRGEVVECLRVALAMARFPYSLQGRSLTLDYRLYDGQPAQ